LADASEMTKIEASDLAPPPVWERNIKMTFSERARRPSARDILANEKMKAHGPANAPRRAASPAMDL